MKPSPGTIELPRLEVFLNVTVAVCGEPALELAAFDVMAVSKIV